MKIINIVLISFLCLWSSVVYATEKPIYQVKAESFLTGLISGEIDKAYDVLMEDSFLVQKQQEVSLLKKQTALGLSMYGKLLGYEFIKQQRYGNSIVRVVYILKCELHPISWEFYFYKPKSKWIVSKIEFNDVFDLLTDK